MSRRVLIATGFLSIALVVWTGVAGNLAFTQTEQTVTSILDLSGLSWVEGDTFLAVHDAKNPEELDRPRVSLLRLPTSLAGIGWTKLSIDWPAPLGQSGDLESVARIPGTNLFLLVESGESQLAGRRLNRVFMVKIENSQLSLDSFVHLPQMFKNIEGSAVAKLGDRFVIICIERGDHRAVTEVYWSYLQLRPLRFGSFQRVYFRPSGFAGRNKRPVTAVEIDSQNRVYVASAYDPEDDNGPFRSVIWRAGRITADRKNVRPGFQLRPVRLATLDGLKVESLAIRESNGKLELFAGTDDENHGGILRPIPLVP
jgi:hypothetical protein